MKQVFKCEYCDFIGNEEDVREHESVCPNNCTGYERVEFNHDYYTHLSDGTIYCQSEKEDGCDDRTYDVANYYSSKKVAENNARADVLMRQLRRFSVEHRDNDNLNNKYYIVCLDGILQLDRHHGDIRYLGPWFDNLHAGGLAIEEFYDELMWYFTEYKDTL